MREPPCRRTASTQNITPKYEHLLDGTIGEFNMEDGSNYSPTDGS
jgi:hypothetical protein